MTNDDKENAEKCQVFECIKCNFKCSKKSNYNNHLSTRKHKMMTNNDTLETEKIKYEKSIPTNNVENNVNKCICGKSYKYRQGLYVHKRKCGFNTESEENTCITDKEIVGLVLKQNKELMKQTQDINDKMMKIMNSGYNNTTNNNYNKTFNLNIFLNHECKDAMNIMDFVDSLKLQLSDLENVGKIGYVNGISDIIVKNLQALDITKRPVHCSDVKREVLYIKDDNQWEKEDRDKNKIRKAIKHIAHKNSKMVNEFKVKYPNCHQSQSKQSDQYLKILMESMGGPGDDGTINENKIIKNIAKEVIIDK